MIGRGIGAVDIRRRRIGRDQRIADIGHIDLGVGDRLPGVRIGVAVVVSRLRRLARRDAFGRDDNGRLVAGGLGQPRHPALEAETVGDDEFRVGNGLRVRRCRRIDMRIAARPDQIGDVDAIAADIAHEVAEDREGRDHLHRLLRLRGGRDGQHRSDGAENERTTEHDAFLYASR